MDKWVFINKEFVKEELARLPVKDLAIQRGYGVFDFFKVMNAIPLFLEDHLNRFFSSAQQMHLTIPLSYEDVKTIIYKLISKNDAANCGIRVTLTGGNSQDGYQIGPPNLILSQVSFTSPTKEDFEKGIKLITYPHQRQLPQIKTIDYLMAIWLQPLLKETNVNDVLYRQHGMVTECPRSNFFMVTKDDKIITPANHILKGITRMKILEIARHFFPIEERNINLEEIKNAKEAFITSTTKNILPVVQIDDFHFSNPNLVSLKLSRLLTQLEAACSYKMSGQIKNKN